MYENWDLEEIVTPVDVNRLEKLLTDADYDVAERNFIISGFRYGFSIGYNGP